MGRPIVTLSASAAEEIASLLQAEAGHWEDDRGDPGDLVTGADALSEQLSSMGSFVVVVQP